MRQKCRVECSTVQSVTRCGYTVRRRQWHSLIAAVSTDSTRNSAGYRCACFTDAAIIVRPTPRVFGRFWCEQIKRCLCVFTTGEYRDCYSTVIIVLHYRRRTYSIGLRGKSGPAVYVSTFIHAITEQRSKWGHITWHNGEVWPHCTSFVCESTLFQTMWPLNPFNTVGWVTKRLNNLGVWYLAPPIPEGSSSGPLGDPAWPEWSTENKPFKQQP